MNVIESISLISINATLVFQLLSFLLFMVLIHRVMIRPLNRLMEERRRLISRIEQDVATAQDELREIERQMKRQEAEARETAADIRDDIEAAGKKSASEMIAATKKEIERLKHQAERESAAQLAEARKGMAAAAATIGDRMAACLLGRGTG